MYTADFSVHKHNKKLKVGERGETKKKRKRSFYEGLASLAGANSFTLLCWQCPLLATRWRRFPHKDIITLPRQKVWGFLSLSWKGELGSWTIFLFCKNMEISSMYKAYELQEAKSQSTPCPLSTPANRSVRAAHAQDQALESSSSSGSL